MLGGGGGGGGGGGLIFAEVYLLTIVSVSCTAGLSVVDLSAESKGAYSL